MIQPGQRVPECVQGTPQTINFEDRTSPTRCRSLTDRDLGEILNFDRQGYNIIPSQSPASVNLNKSQNCGTPETCDRLGKDISSIVDGQS